MKQQHADYQVVPYPKYRRWMVAAIRSRAAQGVDVKNVLKRFRLLFLPTVFSRPFLQDARVFSMLPMSADGTRGRATRFEGGVAMSEVIKNPVVKTRSSEVRGREVSGVIDEFEMKARVGEILNRRPTVGLAVGVVRNGSLEFFHGHGLADIGSNTPITEETVFRTAPSRRPSPPSP
jgi:hypothetical protein